ncbi:extracellular solute-binding protein [Gracilibacillus alcaliphilus]|uniref:extracellular solute-binding protein n=1 Tax=Gracilibacillus alcaliphilus TaxID=1401441 RepID=UPI001956602E|nr:extracellular solute-binding protein [Gracilibacillus alcaliphilus]MBM7677464.1 putative aldouronate transport system substrate-binding protein [Gracilibacillus alcaliphilus]
MRSTTKLLFLFLLAISIIAAGCSNNESTGGNNEDYEPVVTEPGTFPIVEEEVELNVVIPSNSLVRDFETNEFTKWYEEKTGVKVNWEVLPEEGAQEQLNLMLASGDYPDIIMDASLTPAQLRIYGENGTFLALNDLIEEYGIETKRMFEEMPLVEDVITTPDGNIYALPQVNECFHCTMPQKMWVYKPWLDELGLDIPTTTEEYKELLLAIKEEDLNGNGKADEIPLAGQYNGWHADIAAPSSFLIDPFIYSDTHVVNGDVVVPWDKDEYREGLAYIRDLYQEGLIYEGSFTQNGEQYKQLGENPEPILGTAVSAAPSAFSEQQGRMGDYVIIPPLEGPKGQRVSFYLPDPVTRPAEFVITDKAEHPDVALRWADAMYQEEITMRSVLGIEGEDWKQPEEGALGLDGNPATYELIPRDEPIHNNFWDQTGPSLRTAAFRAGQVVVPGDQEQILWEATEQYEPYISEEIEPMPKLFFTEEESNRLAQLEQSITEYIEEMTAAFITGSSNLESEWDQYIDTLNQKGLEEYVDIYQKAYDEKYK